jgi:hypothetical protein
LWTLRENCDFAKEVMNRIQNDINEHTKAEDERHKETQPAAAAGNASSTTKTLASGSQSGKPSNHPISSHSPNDEEMIEFYSTRQVQSDFGNTGSASGHLPSSSIIYGPSGPQNSMDRSDGTYPFNEGHYSPDTNLTAPANANDPNITHEGIAGTAAADPSGVSQTPDASNATPTVRPRRLRVARPLTTIADGIRDIHWDKWKNPLRKGHDDQHMEKE